MTLLFAFLIGFLAGLRSLTAPAVTAWAVHLGWLKSEHPLSLIGSLPAVIILTLAACVELVIDKLPNTPSRTSLPGLLARIVTGGVTGVYVSVSGGHGALVGAGLGAAGGVVGCFAGHEARTRLVNAIGTRDTYVAVVEDLITVGGCLWIVTRY
ncbi:MAG: hypothetical protein JWM21_1210 [Acidobacteria bacterium]|nr:hypothetical protein [Acidobacteriota bacterium]